MSVGSLYQCYPQKQALLFAVLQRYLGAVSDTLVGAAESAYHATLAEMVRTVVGAFVKAKTRNVDASRALYRVAAELDSHAFVRGIEARNQAAFAAMLASASDAEFNDIATASFIVHRRAGRPDPYAARRPRGAGDHPQTARAGRNAVSELPPARGSTEAARPPRLESETPSIRQSTAPMCAASRKRFEIARRQQNILYHLLSVHVMKNTGDGAAARSLTSQP